jgi:16S rRNA (guanine966-N2)-methyltransferase
MNRAPPGSVRIIGGHWRGSKLPVADKPGLRPTADRVRETLFNWLQPVLAGVRVLDLFAGTGALGLEAASRGAASAVLVERDPSLAASLRATAERLHADRVEVVCEDALRWLARSPSQGFDVVFLDPPFEAGLWQPALAALPPWLAADAWLYLEAPSEAPPLVPSDWAVHREGRTREVRYALYRRGAATLAAKPSEQGSARA